MMEELSLIQRLAVLILPVMFAITVHEAAHGWVADKLGDHTARMMGRVTLNPIRHIDLVGTILLPLGMYALTGFMFGWAKPVPVNWRNLGNPRRDTALVAAAGPAANLVMMLFWALMMRVASEIGPTSEWVAMPLVYMGLAGIFINAILMVLNLLPILPLDGGRVLASLLPPQLALPYSRLEPWGLFILIALLATGLLGQILMPLVTVVQYLAFGVASLGN